MWNTDLEPAWWLYHPRRRRGEQRIILCREIHIRTLYCAQHGPTWALCYIHPEETLCGVSVLHHTQPCLPGSVYELSYHLRHKFIFIGTLSFIHTCTSLPNLAGVPWCGREGALFPSVSVGGLWLRSRKGLSLPHPHCLRSTLCSRGCYSPVAQPNLLP